MASKNLKDHKYTLDEDGWLTENIDRYTYPELTVQFNARYGTNIKSVSDRCIKRLGLHKKINSGNCPKGVRRCTNTLPVGSESFDGHTLWIKLNDKVNECPKRRNPSKHHDVNWARKAHHVWEKKYGALKKGSVIVFLNKNPKDCVIDNLYSTTRKVNFMMAKNGWYTESREHTLVALKWCELYYVMKENREN